MIRVHITPTIAYEYASRDIFEECWCGGAINVSRQTAVEMAEDADFYQDRDGPEVGASLKRSYRSLAAQLRRGLTVQEAA